MEPTVVLNTFGAPVLESPVPTPEEVKYWTIHGKRYDLRPFAKNHPGGEYILNLGQGRDCTELYESLHALSTKNQNAILNKYLVKDDTSAPPAESVFVWNKDGFYHDLRRRVSSRFKGRNYKASWFTCFKICVLMALYVFCWVQALQSGNFLWGLLSGALTEMVGFNLMHDASHNAISTKSWINYSGTLWSSWMFWNHWKWLQHHVYGHHSYTGMHSKDPDSVNVSVVIRKHSTDPKKSFMKYQGWYYWIIYTVFPNQHVAQILVYHLADRLQHTKGFLFGMPTSDGSADVERDNIIVMTLSLIFHVIIPMYFISIAQLLPLLFCHFTMMGISYFANVAPNHDTEETKLNELKVGSAMDWGEQQVRSTGNHSISGGWFDKIIFHLWGGMNYQIEHHLFPTVNHCHYPEIAQIVQATCKDHNLPYNGSSSWIGALMSNSHFINRMAHEE